MILFGAKAALIAVDAKWADPETWGVLRQQTGTVTDFDNSYDLIQKTTTLDSSPSLQFREITTVDTAGKAVFDDDTKFFLLGPDSTTPTDGIVIGRGPDADGAAVRAQGWESFGTSTP